jgi:Lrp/AsnC family transcriptional regulator, leucine-responsive regulatory protein
MGIKLDLKDRKIIYQLDLNARQSNAEIAKKVRLSKDAVGYRIKKLEELGIIRGYKTIIDSSRLGYLFYRVFFNLMDLQPAKLEALIDFLKKQKNVWWIAKLDGSWNFAFAIWVKSNKEFNKFYHTFGLKFRQNVKERLICPVVLYKNLSKKYLLETRNEVKITTVGEGEKQNFDQTDFKILKSLAENARTPLIDIAHELKLDSMTIHHRIKKLENKEIIQGYKVDLDTRKLGRDFYSVKINLRDLSKTKEIKDYILTIPEVTATTEAIGSYDIEFDLEVENSEKYFQILEEIETKFEFIRDVIYFRVLKNYKILYLPEI